MLFSLPLGNQNIEIACQNGIRSVRVTDILNPDDTCNLINTQGHSQQYCTL